MKTKVMLFFLIFLLSIPISLFASTSGAFGSGKPVMIRARKDFTEALIKKSINEKLADLNKDTFSFNLHGTDISVSTTLHVTDVFVGRNFDCSFYTSPERYDFVIMLTMGTPEVTGIDGAESYFKLFFNRYKMETVMPPNYQDIKNQIPQMYVKGTITPTDDTKMEWKLQLEDIEIKQADNSFLDSVNLSDSSVTTIKKKILAIVNAKINKITIDNFMAQDLYFNNTKVEIKNSVIDFGKPDQFSRDVDGIATETYINNILL